MIDKLRSIAIFATVVERGSFRAAATVLGLAPSRVSQAVSDLEKGLGVTLLYRSTRHLSLSNEGRLLYEKAQTMMNLMESGLDALSSTSSEPQGTLRLTVPAFVTQTDMMSAFATFSQTYSKITLSLQFSDHPQNLIKDGYDVAIRAGWLEDSELMARNIGRIERVLVSSPRYIEDRPNPEHPSDLEQWDWIRFAMRPDQTVLISHDGDEVGVTGRSRISVNSAAGLYEFAIRGLGATVIPMHMAGQAIQRGELVRILPNWSSRARGLHAVWPDQSRRENLTLLFVRFLAQAAQTWPS